MDDLFISYVAADRPAAQELAEKLQKYGVEVALIQLGLGDSLTYRMEQGFRKARYGALILSPDFFKKPWPRSELSRLAMIDREFDEQSRLFPLWRQITQAEIARYSPELASRVGVPAGADLDAAVNELLETIRPEEAASWSKFPSEQTRSINLQQAAQAESVINPPLNDPRRLHKALTQYFSMGELADLAWDMNIDYENIPGTTKNAKARELVAYSRRHGRLDELSRLVQQRRPFI